MVEQGHKFLSVVEFTVKVKNNLTNSEVNVNNICAVQQPLQIHNNRANKWTD